MKTTIIITGVIFALFGTLYILARLRMKNVPLVANNERILTLSDKNFDHQTKNRIVLVDFWGRMVCSVQNDGSCSE